MLMLQRPHDLPGCPLPWPGPEGCCHAASAGKDGATGVCPLHTGKSQPHPHSVRPHVDLLTRVDARIPEQGSAGRADGPSQPPSEERSSHPAGEERGV